VANKEKPRLPIPSDGGRFPLQKQLKIHVWVPEYTSAVGGIQTFSRFIIRALRDIFPGAWLDIFSKNDTSFPDPSGDPTDSFTPLGWWSSRLRTPVFAAELARRAFRDRPDIIITTHVNFAPAAHSMKRLLGIPFLAIGHGIEVWEVPNKHIYRALRAANGLAAVSHFTRDRMAAALHLPKERISLLPNTFDPDQFYPDIRKPRFLLKRYGLRADQPVILTIARLASAERYKGYDQVLRALPRVCERFPDVRYILGGRGPDRPRIESLIKELDLAKNVTLAGYVAEHELRGHYNLCDVFAMPSKGEGFGIVFLEALGCGKPVLAGDKDGSVDAVLNGELGILVDPDSIAQIVEALIQILARKHSHQLLLDPQALRNRTIGAYGYKRFVTLLEHQVQALFCDEGKTGKAIEESAT
jgi:glycosyltransferase involved in cell wall biosynthesis